MSLSLSMAAFALAASISPGPVNIVALGSGARHGLRASLAHVAGATLGFCSGYAAALQATVQALWTGPLQLLRISWQVRCPPCDSRPRGALARVRMAGQRAQGKGTGQCVCRCSAGLRPAQPLPMALAGLAGVPD